MGYAREEATMQARQRGRELLGPANEFGLVSTDRRILNVKLVECVLFYLEY